MKLRNKLILSCAALAAVATTAVSSTFAWYTSNEVVSVDTITAKTQNSGADLLMIADGQKINDSGIVQDVSVGDLKWGTTIEHITLSGATVSGTFKPTEMTPLAYNGTVDNASHAANTTGGALVGYADTYVAATGNYVEGTTYYKDNTGSAVVDTTGFDNTTSVASYFVKKLGTSSATTDSAGYLQFVLFLKNAGTSEKNIKFRFTDLTYETTKANLPAKSIVDPVHNATYIGLGSSAVNYTVNALRVAAVDIEVKAYTSSGVGALQDESVYALNTAVASPTYNDDAASVPANGAHNYFNAIMDTPLNTADAKNVNTETFKNLGAANGTYLTDATTTGSGTSAVSTANAKLPSAATVDQGFQVTFKVFLNGWDKWCFDACQNQTLTFDLAFNV